MFSDHCDAPSYPTAYLIRSPACELFLTRMSKFITSVQKDIRLVQSMLLLLELVRKPSFRSPNLGTPIKIMN